MISNLKREKEILKKEVLGLREEISILRKIIKDKEIKNEEFIDALNAEDLEYFLENYRVSNMIDGRKLEIGNVAHIEMVKGLRPWSKDLRRW